MNENSRHKLARTLTLLIDECDLELVKGVRDGTMPVAAAKKFAANTEKLREFRDELEALKL